MRIAVQIPIKARSSERVPNKNFRDLAGKPLCMWLLDELIEHAPPDWDIYIDSENQSAYDFIDGERRKRFLFHKRQEWFAGNEANGNHLLYQFGTNRIDYDIYVQLFITAVALPGPVIVETVDHFVQNVDKYDSVLHVVDETGWFWYQGKPMNYDPTRPAGLPRSQDAMLLKESTGLYAITRSALFKTGCRVGSKPHLYKIPLKYALDIDTMDDFHEAEKALADRR